MWCDFEEPEHWPEHWEIGQTYPWGVNVLWYGLDGLRSNDQEPLKITAWCFGEGPPNREPTIAEVLGFFVGSLNAEGRSFWDWAFDWSPFAFPEVDPLKPGVHQLKPGLDAYLWYLEMLRTAPRVRAFFNDDHELIEEVRRATGVSDESEPPSGVQSRDSEDPDDPEDSA